MLYKIKRVELLNFGGLKGGYEIEFKEGITFVRGRNEWPEGDSNGVCKTTILNGISWGLYGRTPEGASKFEVINRECEIARSSIELGDLSIKRTITASGERLEFTHLGLMHSSISPTKKEYRLRQAQEELNKYLGIDFHTFCNAIYLGPSSKTIKFLEAEPGERAKMLSVLINTNVFSIAADLIKKDIDLREKYLKEIETQIEFCNQRDAEVDIDIESLQQSLDQMKKSTESKDLLAKKEKARIKREFEAAKAALAKQPSADMEFLAKEKASLDAFIKKKDRELFSAKVQLKNMEKFDDDDVCPTCTQPVSKEKKKEIHFIVETLTSKIEDWKIDLENAIEEKEELDKMMAVVRQEHKEKIEAQRNIDTLKGEMQLLKDHTLKPEMGPVQRLLAEKKEFKAKNLNNKAEFKLQRKTIKQRLDYLKKGKVWLGTDIRNYMFDTIRSKLSIYGNEFLDLLTGGRFRVEFPIDSKREKFDITILRNGIEAPRSTLSGGEKWRVKISLALAFRSILMENVTTKYGVFLLDDDLGVVDEKGLEKWQELIRKYKDHLLPQVIATVPKDVLIENADQILTVQRKLNDEVEIFYE